MKRWPYERVTMATAGGRYVDIVKNPAHAVSEVYLLYHQLEAFLSRAKELGVQQIGGTAFRVLQREGLIHIRQAV